jgi:chemotaxis protein MotB
LQGQYADLNRRYEEAVGKIGVGAALPPQLDSALRDFAAQNPDLVDFDSARGIVKFKSDVTFALGSAEVTPKAKEAIARFAQILNSQAASGYELMVAGHTDSTRVSRPETIQAGHKDNWYLSAHRAIAVGNQLQADRVSPQRLAVVGYADQRPVASNSSESGRAQNRRVEVLILPTTVRGTGVADGAPKAPAANKDTAAGDPGPAFNK